MLCKLGLDAGQFTRYQSVMQEYLCAGIRLAAHNSDGHTLLKEREKEKPTRRVLNDQSDPAAYTYIYILNVQLESHLSRAASRAFELPFFAKICGDRRRKLTKLP